MTDIYTGHNLGSTRSWTGRAIGACPKCGSGVAYEGKANFSTATCPNCGATVRLEYVYGNKSNQPCDGACMGAIGKWCSCSCGGANHGKMWLPVELVPTWTAADKERIKKVRAKRIKDFADRTERKRQSKEDKIREGKEQLLTEHPLLAKLFDAAWYFADSESGQGSFLSDMKHALSQGEMTPRQISAACNAIEKIDARREREARWEAEREALKANALAKGIKVETGRYLFEGEIISYREEEDPFSYHGGTKVKILVKDDDGRKIWGSLPGGLRVRFDQDDDGNNSYKGRRIKFNVTVKPSDDDPLFGFFSRPAKGEWVSANA